VLLDYYFTYFLEGAIGLIRQWLRDDNLSTNEVATALTELTQARIHPLPA
jgi:predicted XRE-type DNA-binding protein